MTRPVDAGKAAAREAWIRSQSQLEDCPRDPPLGSHAFDEAQAREYGHAYRNELLMLSSDSQLEARRGARLTPLEHRLQQVEAGDLEALIRVFDTPRMRQAFVGLVARAQAEQRRRQLVASLQEPGSDG